MKSKVNNKQVDYTPETINGACMTGRIPTEKEFKEMEVFFAKRKASVKLKKSKPALK